MRSNRRSLLHRPGWLWIIATSWWATSGLATVANYWQMVRDGTATVTARHVWQTTMTSCALWVPLTVAIFLLVRRFPLERDRLRQSLCVHVIGSITIVFVRAGLIALANPWIGWYETPPSFGSVLITSFDHNLFLYWMFVGVASALHFAHRTHERDLQTERLRGELARSQLATLYAQLNPHLIFNTLNSISELVHRDAQLADQMILRLSALLREALHSSRDPLIPLDREFELTRSYLAIEEVRFDRRLRVVWDIGVDAKRIVVPCLLLQPLVENALHHGLVGAPQGTLWIRCHMRNGELVLEVEDDGAGVTDPGNVGTGTGLSNTRARLTAIYAQHARLELHPRDPHGTRLCITLPARPAIAASPPASPKFEAARTLHVLELAP